MINRKNYLQSLPAWVVFNNLHFIDACYVLGKNFTAIFTHKFDTLTFKQTRNTVGRLALFFVSGDETQLWRGSD